MGSTESTDTFMRDKVKPYVDSTVRSAVDKHTEITQTMQAQTVKQLQQLHDVQRQMQDTLIGKMPPDPNNPSMWQSLQELLGWKKGVNKVLWIACTSAIGAIVGTVWIIIRNSGGLQ